MKLLDHDFSLSENDEVIRWICSCGLKIVFIKTEEKPECMDHISFNFENSTHFTTGNEYFDKVREFHLDVTETVLGKLERFNHNETLICNVMIE